MGFSVACFPAIHASRQDIIASDEEYEPNALPQTAEEWLQDIAKHPDVIRSRTNPFPPDKISKHPRCSQKIQRARLLNRRGNRQFSDLIDATPVRDLHELCRHYPRRRPRVSRLNFKPISYSIPPGRDPKPPATPVKTVWTSLGRGAVFISDPPCRGVLG